MLLQFQSRVTENLCLSVKATEGTVNLWQGIVVKTSGYYGTFSKSGQSWAKDGNFQMTTGDLVSGRRAIAVAAYNSKVNFTNVSGTALTYSGNQRGRIASFSSFGPTADGRIKPNIAGPGLALASGVSSFDSSYMDAGDNYQSVVSKSVSPTNGRTYSYAMAAGTSMSSPAVSGIVALLLEANPALGPEQVLEIFRQTALKDAYTGVIPTEGTNVWGFGKVNAMGSMKLALNPTGIRHSKTAQSLLVYPNPGTGKFFLENLDSQNMISECLISDVLGRKIEKISFSTDPTSGKQWIDLGGHADGIYWMLISTPNGRVVIQILKGQ